jgi:hypothetical protein
MGKGEKREETYRPGRGSGDRSRRQLDNFDQMHIFERGDAFAGLAFWQIRPCVILLEESKIRKTRGAKPPVRLMTPGHRLFFGL